MLQLKNNSPLAATLAGDAPGQARDGRDHGWPAAHAPRGRKVEQLDAKLAVADREKVVRVFGDRECSAGFMGTSRLMAEGLDERPVAERKARIKWQPTH